MHHESFIATSRKARDLAVDVVCGSLARSKGLAVRDIGGDDIAVMYDGMWHKRGHKSHKGTLEKAECRATGAQYGLAADTTEQSGSEDHNELEGGSLPVVGLPEPLPCTEATSDASHDEVPMDVHPGAKPTKRRALAQPANNEDRDFKTEVKETLNDIKNALRVVVESIAVLDSRVTKIEADHVKALQSAEATPAQVIPKVKIVQKVATRSVSQETAFEGPNNGGTP
ncbi:hypothetical protein HPB51_008909 [Rhipicephalus microplus]|uniref:Uncharacterized protein n=1 Tax=Rhipicephalus microplus TaxID=6941 RepID=A0A9J6DLZ5_RHIMP|nr:hypothetical protein HPB51_008909 [Rhipicephalus microplus]